jgi:hypothetical protein
MGTLALMQLHMLACEWLNFILGFAWKSFRDLSFAFAGRAGEGHSPGQSPGVTDTAGAHQGGTDGAA